MSTLSLHCSSTMLCSLFAGAMADWNVMDMQSCSIHDEENADVTMHADCTGHIHDIGISM